MLLIEASKKNMKIEAAGGHLDRKKLRNYGYGKINK